MSIHLMLNCSTPAACPGCRSDFGTLQPGQSAAPPATTMLSAGKAMTENKVIVFLVAIFLFLVLIICKAASFHSRTQHVLDGLEKKESFYRLMGHTLHVTHSSASLGHLARPCLSELLFVQHLSVSLSLGHTSVSRAANPARPLHATTALASTCFPVLNKSRPPLNPPGSESCAWKVTLRWCSLG